MPTGVSSQKVTDQLRPIHRRLYRSTAAPVNPQVVTPLDIAGDQGFHGRMSDIRYLARCRSCKEQGSFPTQRARDDYARVHMMKTGHQMDYSVDTMSGPIGYIVSS